MTSTLLTFLGRVAKGERGYRTLRYRFPDGEETPPVAFLGWPLASKMNLNRLVILGTSGSMWDHLFEGDFGFGNELEDLRLELVDAVEARTASAEHLRPLEPLLTERIGCEVRLALIPYARRETEQVKLLGTVAEHVATGDRVALDITHGFRHLPMLGLLAALYLRRVRGAGIEHIWYGMLDADSCEARVHDLAGLLRIADWLDALAIYDHSGDYSVFRKLTGDAGEQLARAAFFERTTNTVKAREALTGWSSRGDRLPSADRPEIALFADALEDRIAWHRCPDRSAWEAALAWRYLDEGDYLRAALFAHESVISTEVQRRGGAVNDFDARDAARGELRDMRDGFRRLARIRNALAHGIRPNEPTIKKLLAGESELRATLQDLFRILLPL